MSNLSDKYTHTVSKVLNTSPHYQTIIEESSFNDAHDILLEDKHVSIPLLHKFYGFDFEFTNDEILKLINVMYYLALPEDIDVTILLKMNYPKLVNDESLTNDMKYVIDNIILEDNILYNAMKQDARRLLEYLNITTIIQSLEVAIKYSNIRVIRLLFDNNVQHCKQTMAGAIKTNNAEIVKLMFDNNVSLANNPMRTAMCTSNVEIVRLMFEHNVPIKPNIMNHALKSRNLEIVKLTLEHDVKITDEIFRTAIRESTVEIVKYLMEYGISHNM